MWKCLKIKLLAVALNLVGFGYTPFVAAQNSWQQGLQDLKRVSRSETTEITAIYLDNCNNDGLWHWPKVTTLEPNLLVLSEADIRRSLDIYM